MSYDYKLNYAKNREARLAQRKAYAEANREHVKKQRREIDLRYKSKHRVDVRARHKAWVERNRKYVNAKMRHYRKLRYKSDPSFRAAVLDAYHLRRSKMRIGTSNRRIIKQFIAGVRSSNSVVCYYCQTKVSGRSAHIEHIVPLSKGGPHSIENLCTSCASCNLSKKTKTIRDWMRLGQQLLEL